MDELDAVDISFVIFLRKILKVKIICVMQL